MSEAITDVRGDVQASGLNNVHIVPRSAGSEVARIAVRRAVCRCETGSAPRSWRKSPPDARCAGRSGPCIERPGPSILLHRHSHGAAAPQDYARSSTPVGIAIQGIRHWLPFPHDPPGVLVETQQAEGMVWSRFWASDIGVTSVGINIVPARR